MLSDFLCSALGVGGDSGAKALSTGISHACGRLSSFRYWVQSEMSNSDLKRLALNSVLQVNMAFKCFNMWLFLSAGYGNGYSNGYGAGECHSNKNEGRLEGALCQESLAHKNNCNAN